MDWSGVDYCDVFISCLDSHSDGTHSLQRIHWWASVVMLHFSKSDEETNSSTSWMAWGWVNVHFGWTFPLTSSCRISISSSTKWSWVWWAPRRTRELFTTLKTTARFPPTLQKAWSLSCSYTEHCHPSPKEMYIESRESSFWSPPKVSTRTAWVQDILSFGLLLCLFVTFVL